MTKQVLVGFLFFVGLIIVGFSTLIVGNFKIFGPSYTYTVAFDTIEGLKKGDDVRVDGVMLGKVSQIKLGASGVLVTIDMNEPLQLYSDHTIIIEPASALGGNYLSIMRGKNVNAPYEIARGLHGKSAKSGLDEIGKLVADNREDFHQVLGTIKDILKELKDGQGSAGKLLKDEKLFNELTAAAENIKETFQKVNKGEGTLAKLINDSKVFDDISKALQQVNEIIDKVKKGEGTIGKLLKDDALYENLRQITERVKSGSGTLSKLLNDEKMGEDLKGTIEDLRETSTYLKSILKKIDSGEGTVGKLIQEKTLYEKADKAVTNIDSIVGKAAQVKFYLGGDYRTFTSSKVNMGKIYARIAPSEDKYFLVGGTFFSLDPHGDVDYDGKDDGDSEDFVKGDLQIAYRIPWILDKRMTARAGLLEGKPGGAIDLEWSEFGIFNHPFQLTFEGRSAYNSVKHDGMDENIDGAMLRTSIKTSLAKEGFFKYFKLFAGVSRLGDGPEFFGGGGFEYDDEDLRTLISVMGLSR